MWLSIYIVSPRNKVASYMWLSIYIVSPRNKWLSIVAGALPLPVILVLSSCSWMLVGGQTCSHSGTW